MLRLSKNFCLSGMLALSAVLYSATALAETASEKGLRIAQERKASDQGWGNTEAQTSMILRNASGDESVRKMRMRALEVNGDGDKGLTIFDQPRDVAGTLFLNHSHIDAADDQWLYLPALKRVKRIASRNKSGPFMGSEFSYEDLVSFEVEKFTYKFLREETLDGQVVDVVEADPTDKYSGYSRQISWVDQMHSRVHKVEFYDRKNALLKTLTFSDYRLYKDKYWRAHMAKMVNHQTGKSTDLITHTIEFDVGLRDADFARNALLRIR